MRWSRSRGSSLPSVWKISVVLLNPLQCFGDVLVFFYICPVWLCLLLPPPTFPGFAKDMGKMAGELKDVPKEFQVRPLLSVESYLSPLPPGVPPQKQCLRVDTAVGEM